MAQTSETFNEKFNAANADIIFRALGGEYQESARLFRFKKSELAGSKVMQDMLAVGNEEKNGSIPIVNLSEEPKVVAMLLSFLSNDLALFPDLAATTMTEVLDVYRATVKYQMPVIMVLLEQSICHRPTSLGFESAIRLYGDVHSRDRTDLIAWASKCIIEKYIWTWKGKVSSLSAEALLDLAIYYTRHRK